MKAVDKYDPHRGVKVVSFAVHWIKAEIHEYIPVSYTHLTPVSYTHLTLPTILRV